MPDVTTMNKPMLVQVIGTVIKELDVLRSCFDLGTPEKKKLDGYRNTLNAAQHTIVEGIIKDNTEQFKAHTASLTVVNQELLTTIGDVAKIAETLKSLVKFIEDVAEIIGMVAAPSIPTFMAAAPLVTPFAMEARIAGGPARVRWIRAEPVEAPQVFSDEEERALIPIEEVLYGVELTPEKLIITVATGGCTGEDSFHVEVNKGYTGLPPYLVTVYRIVSDNCKGIFEPMKIAFSREKLGLDEAVEFILLNKIGNTSQHRLNS